MGLSLSTMLGRFSKGQRLLGVVLLVAGLFCFFHQPPDSLPAYVLVRGDFSAAEAATFFRTSHAELRREYWKKTWSSVRKRNFSVAWHLVKNGRPSLAEIVKQPDGTLVASATNQSIRMNYTVTTLRTSDYEKGR